MERLQKIIAHSGVTSRRAAEDLITAGRVRVNGRVVTELGAKADPREDRIEVDGKRLVAEDPVYLVLHKPRGVVSTLNDPEGRPTVGEMIKGVDARLYPVGRLDYATSGVLLMTNDGDFANGLLHPRGGVSKTYVLKVQGSMADTDLEVWRTGIELEDGLTQPTEARIIRHEDDKTWLEVTLREGRNQQIRRMGDATGWRVMRLARTIFAGVTSEGLRPGEWRAMTADELLDIRKAFGVPRKVRSAAARMAASDFGGPRPHGTVRRSLSAHHDGANEGGPRQDERSDRARPARGDRSGDVRADRGADRRPHEREESGLGARGGREAPRRSDRTPAVRGEPAGAERHDERGLAGQRAAVTDRARPRVDDRGRRGEGPPPRGDARQRPSSAQRPEHREARPANVDPRRRTSSAQRPERSEARPANVDPRRRTSSAQRPERSEARPVRAGRSDRSETTPRGAATRAPRARGRGGR